MAKITFSSISIENLGPFRDRQTLDLSVTSSRSVILVKALNGSGKTTLLTALQIGLYGAKAINAVRRTEYEQLIGGLQRKDATGNAVVTIGLIVDVGGARKELAVRREWSSRGGSLAEAFSVNADGIEDLEFTQNWDEFIGNILPAELVQLFLFDGEKIEALANPDRLPDLLRRATEVFLGIGGIDVLGNDLKAVERRAALRNKENSGQYEALRANLVELEGQAETLTQKRADLLQDQAATRNGLDQAQTTLDRYMVEARRGGLGAYEKAASIRTNAAEAKGRASLASNALVDAFSDPVLPVAWLGDLWTRYGKEWELDRQSQHSKLLAEEFKKRDRRVLDMLSGQASTASVDAVRKILKQDLDAARSTRHRKPLLMSGAEPTDVNGRIERSGLHVQASLALVESSRRELSKAERALGEVPADEQLSNILSKMQERSHVVATAEQRLADITQTLTDVQNSLKHVEARLNGTRARLNTDFKDRSLEGKGIEAASRARQLMIVFKERLLASKANWLSDMITTEFKNLLRKRKLVSRVIVDPATYRVGIEDVKGHELPMDRLSAGERQMLAIAVLSALIKERKGRFPVVVDTPLARLDRQHRTSLIKRFFATVSHQVVVLSTDEEVDGAAYDALRPHTNKEYVLEFNDEGGHTVACDGASRSESLEVA
ncbi:DNA sulfur modification protein DndD [Paraburkholderia caledonica]|uniref:DNA sulfur modification protein DndD n=1 Tax=Paraburkholderia caledonica TaxID=134536 RepID=UPI000DEFC5F5|nr:DNA sulfur modification protein DndD [Paraburkholderia caledonica]AXF12991.1 DNA sulfur modification protein DndD [Paraburkholderia caledonica]